LRFPADLFFLDKTFGTLDGTVRLLSPNLDMSAIAEEFGAEQGLVPRDMETLIKELGVRLLEDADSVVEMPILLRRIMRRVDEGFLEIRTGLHLTSQAYAQLNRLGLKLLGGSLGLFLLVLAWITRDAPPQKLPFDLSLPSLLLLLGLLLILLTGWSLWKEGKSCTTTAKFSSSTVESPFAAA
jgi:ubiquinone biosynthesis protein